ncbi:DUF2220 domain-containing protein [Bifidobacterium gallicum]|nr:DUF2220 domain-containing protein [Bifidobacterium gallicum]EFA23130.1 hypothetical protein BIFGAL_03243 [Bifidobacterium gallicum DSM 20093 = LMG 11596]
MRSEVTKRIGGRSVSLTGAIIIPDQEAALRVADVAIRKQYAQGMTRIRQLHDQLAVSDQTARRVIHLMRTESDIDFLLLIQATQCVSNVLKEMGYRLDSGFLDIGCEDCASTTTVPRCAPHVQCVTDEQGKTSRVIHLPWSARELPLAGFSAKWLGSQSSVRRRALTALLGLDGIQFVERPGELRLRYLANEYELLISKPWTPDTDHQVDMVIIVENKDTYQHMPNMPQFGRGVVVFGQGRVAQKLVSQLLPWITQVPVVYWGDMDADGLEILDGLRGSGVCAYSVLMDENAYAEYADFATALDAASRPIVLHAPKQTPSLTPDERDLYVALSEGGSHSEAPRIEQERIPLDVACRAIAAIMRNMQKENGMRPDEDADCCVDDQTGDR